MGELIFLVMLPIPSPGSIRGGGRVKVVLVGSVEQLKPDTIWKETVLLLLAKK